MPKKTALPLPVVLATDFGPSSAYVGQMKCVLEARAPGVRVIDLAHDLPPQNVAAAALVLRAAWAYLPRPCVLVTVVDPSVGSPRRIVAAHSADDVIVLAPDNGLAAALLAGQTPRALRAVTNRALFLPRVSPVFHGRDLFAPVAAPLALGLDLSKVGPVIAPRSLVQAPYSAPRQTCSGLRGEVVFVDHFGNLITNIRAEDLDAPGKNVARASRARPSSFRVLCKHRTVPLVTHYAEAGKGQLLALIGSFGHLEIARRDGSATAFLRARPGTPVDVLI